MKKLFFILLLALLTVPAGAQHRHDHHAPHGRGHERPHIECATHEQMSMVMHTLSQQSFDDKKLEIAKLCVVLGHFCVDDLARIASAFSFDDSRLTFLIFCLRLLRRSAELLRPPRSLLVPFEFRYTHGFRSSRSSTLSQIAL